MKRPTVTTTMARRCVDLGRLDPTCPAAYHGTYPAYVKGGCRCPHAREARRLYHKRMREGRNEPVLLDSTGDRRRVQGMWALGHTSATIAAESGGLRVPQVIRTCHQPFVTPRQHELIVGAYQVLINRPGKSARLRNKARREGFPLPVQWGADIDDPNAVPEPIEPEPNLGFVDEDAVEMALAGRPVDLSDAELVAAIQGGIARGMSVQPLAAALRVDHRLVKAVAFDEVPPRFASAVRRRSALVRQVAA